MLHYTVAASSTRAAIRTAARKFSASPLEADSGALATRVHHGMCLALTVVTPIYFILPEDGAISRGIGVFLAGNVTAHSWIGMNYVCTDYVPKVSKALLGPSRYFNAGMALVTFAGLVKMSISSPGGIKGAIRGLWNPLPEKK
jgi:CybS, succinate dehydrogenase cytochrome B small subunit